MASNKTRRALLSSVLSLVLCCSMLIGTTFAWFTDEVTSENNIIKSGTLNVEMYYGDTADAITNSAATGTIFDYKYWEPGYTQTKYVKITNEGDLAFKFQLNIVPDVVAVAGAIDLAKVIDVYMFPATTQVTREVIAAATPVGTLADLMADADGAAHGILLPAAGVGSEDYNTIENAPRGEIAYAIALKMQESAGNEYQDKVVGGEGFKVQLIATQYTWENDSFDHEYDENADFLPKATVIETGRKLVDTVNYDEIMANTTFQFLPNETLAEAEKSFYRYYHADFVVSADRNIPEGAVILPGYYKAYADYTGDQRWIGISNDDVEIEAGTEIRLIQVLSEALGGNVTVNYEEICKWGNDGTGFLCGVSDQSNGALAGTTLTVELRLYETTGDPTTTTGSKNEETGEYVVIGTYTYTFGEEILVGTVDQLQDALNVGGKIELTQDLDLADDQLTIAAGTTATLDLNGYDLTGAHDGTDHYAMFTIENGGKLTVKGEGEVTAATNFTESNRSGALFMNAGELVLESGTYTLDDSTTGQTWIIATIVDNRTNSASCATKLTINGGEYSVTGSAQNLFRNYPQQGGTASLTINAGTFNANADKDTTYIWNQESNNYVGTMTFNGGTYVGNVVYEDYNGQSDIFVSDAAVAGGLKAYANNS